MKQISIKSESEGRLDAILADEIEDLTRQKVQKAIKDGLVFVNGKETKKTSYKIVPGDEIKIKLAVSKAPNLKAQKIALDVVHEDKDYLIINKPAGLVVHPAPGHADSTLVNAILYHLKEQISQKDDPVRPGIVHRLDKETSGIIIVAKNDKAHQNISEQITNRTVKKKYITLVEGIIDHKGIIEAPIGRHPGRRQDMAVLKTGKNAITEFIPLQRFENATLLEVDLKTGRTHQIRVHMASIGHPVLGDKKYGKTAGLDRQFLHASEIEFLDLKGKIPHDLEEVLDRFKEEI